jgi:peptide/nickel transport system permease protein
LLTFLARRLAYSLLVVAGVLVVVFVTTRLIGDPARIILPATASQADYELQRSRMGLDQPIVSQFLQFVAGALRGDFGMSLWDQNTPALVEVVDRLPATFQLVLAGTGLAMLVAVPAGILAARRPRSLLDRTVTVLSLAGFSVPNFLVAITLIIVFAVGLGWFYTSGFGTIRHLVLPAIAVALPIAGRMTQFVRSTMIDEFSRPYIATARSKGVSEPAVALRHALRNAAIPILTLGGWEFTRQLAGYTVAVEVVFAWPGVGQLASQAILRRDFTVIAADVFLVAIIVLVINLLIDMLYMVLDPRIKVA